MEENDNALTRVDTEYGANQIQVLDGLEHVRKRPGMYIGGVDDKALHHLIWEVADNAIDEYLAGHGKRVIVTIEKAGSIMVQDFARGIPTDIHPKTGKSTLETVMTTLGAGGKFGGDSGYAMSGGLHGVGASVVNALSEWCIAKVYRDGKLYYQKYEKGVPTSDVKNQPQKDNGTRTGTTIQFLPDKTIFETMIFNYEYIQRRLRELAFLNKGLRIDLKDERDGKVESFHYEGGIKSYIEFLNKGKKTLNDIIYIEDNSDKELLVEFAMQYNTQYEETSLSFVNNIYTSMGGTHLTGFKSGLLKSLTKKVFPYYKNSDDPELKGLKKKLDKLENEMSQEDILEGLTVIVSVKMKDPQFEGQTKAKLASTKVRGKIDELTSRNVGEYFIHNKEVIKKILIKIIDATDARLAARQAKELSRQKGMLVQLESPFANSILPGKLTDCSNTKVEHRELFVCEGDSATGALKQGRDSKGQACLPLKGKILNIEKAKEAKIYQNEEIQALMIAIGILQASEIKDKKKLEEDIENRNFDFKKIRYGRIILTTDADVDGSHIRCLLLTFLYRFAPELIEQGYIYVAQPPLFKLERGKKIDYFYTDKELDDFKVKNDLKNLPISRFKGLGEMSPHQLWDTTLNPKTRTLRKITLTEAEDYDFLFEMLMGENIVARKKFIEENAIYANIDV